MRVAGVIVAVFGGACFYDEGSPLPDDFAVCTAPDDFTGVAAPTWYRDVQPIIAAKCQGCHTDGGIAPFALTGYTQIAGLRELVHEAVTSRRMPPWQPDPCCTSYQYDRSLSDADEDTLLRWIENGVPVGDPADAPPVSPPPTRLPRVDLRAEMPEAFLPEPKVGSDEIRCFLLDHAAIERTQYIVGFDFQPGVRAMVHHVIVNAVDEEDVAKFEAKDGADGRPGWDCWGDGGEITQSSKYIGGWQPGVLPRLLPEGIGRELPPRTRIMLNVHYDTAHGTTSDRSAIDLMLADEVERTEKAVPIGNPLWFVGDGMKIDAGDPDASTWFAYDPSQSVTRGKAVQLHNVMLHMHELGSSGRVAILRAGGTAECLVNISQWDFHWMADYYFAEPIELAPGDKLYVECHWDNSAANQRLVNGVREPPRDLYWKTEDEMCGAVVLYSEAAE